MDAPAAAIETAPFVRDIVIPMDRRQGDKLPVSVFRKYGVLDGTRENGTSSYHSKWGVAPFGLKRNTKSCIQCCRCAMRCPHAAIRPVLLWEEKKANMPASFITVPAKGLGKDAPPISSGCRRPPYGCPGCGVYLTACPANQSNKSAGALIMTPFGEMKPEQENFDKAAVKTGA